MSIDYNVLYEALRINSLNLLKLIVISYFIFYWIPSKIFPQDHMRDILDKILFNALYSMTFALLVIPQLVVLKIFSMPLYILILIGVKLFFITYYEKRSLKVVFSDLKKNVLVSIFDFFDNYEVVIENYKENKRKKYKKFISNLTVYKFFLSLFYFVVFAYAVFNIEFNNLITFTNAAPDISFFISWIGYLKENILWSDLNTFGAVMYGTAIFVYNLYLWTNIDSIILFKIFPTLIIFFYFFSIYYVTYRLFKSRFTSLFAVAFTSLVFYSPLNQYFTGLEFPTAFPEIKTFFDSLSFYYVPPTPENLKAGVMYANIPYNRFFAGLGYEVSCTMFLLNLYFMIRFAQDGNRSDLVMYTITLFTVFSFHGGGSMFLAPAQILVFICALIYRHVTLKKFSGAIVGILIAAILGNLWMLAMFKYGLLLDVGDALPILDEILGTKKQVITATETGKEIMYLLIMTPIQYAVIAGAFIAAIVSFFLKREKFLISTMMVAILSVYFVYYMPHLGPKRLVAVARGVEYLMSAQIILFTFVFYFINLILKKVLRGFYLPITLTLFYIVFFIGVISFPKWHNAKNLPKYTQEMLFPKNVEMISYSANGRIILDINKLYRPFSWTLVSYVQEYGKAKDKGYHLNTQQFLMDYDPRKKYLEIPTEYIFILEEVYPNEYKGKNEWRYRWRREIEDNLRSWIAIYSSNHDNIRLFRSTKNVNVYIIENKDYIKYLAEKERQNR